jgi:lysylphosphatidylglycerol synthetase-like protein (DUF2156 family)
MVAAAVIRFLRARPVALALTAVTLLCGVLAGAPTGGPGPAVRRLVALDPDGLLHRGGAALLTSVLVANGPAELVLVLAALVLGVGACERLLGHRRTALAWLVTAVLGGLGGTGLQALGLLARGAWATPPITTLVLHPETPVLGVLLAASAYAGPLWRRRIRLIGFTALVVLLLYSGQPEDLDHLAGAVVGLLLGLLLARGRPRRAFARSSHAEARSLLAVVVAIGAIGPVVAVLQPKGYGLLRPLGRLFRDPVLFSTAVRRRCVGAVSLPDCDGAVRLAHQNGAGPLLLSVLPLVVLLVAAVAVVRGRRAGAWLAVGVNALLATVGAVYYGLLPALGDADQIQDLRSQLTLQSGLAVLVPLGIAVAVLVGRRHCPVLPRRRALLGGVAAVGGVVVGTSALLLAVGLLLHHQVVPRPTPLDLLAELPERYVPTGFLRFRRMDFFPVGPLAAVVSGWMGAVAWLTVLVAGIGVTMSARRSTTGRELLRLRELLAVGAGGSISWMATWPENRVWFSADGEHAIAYRDASGVALTVGEPIGREGGADRAAREFALHCDDQGLVPAFYSVRPSFAARLGGGGAPWSSIRVGEDTVVDPLAFSMRGKHWADVRSSINRADRAGVRQVWTTWAALPLAQRSQIEAISEEWVADKRLPELGFTLGGPAQLVDPEVRLMLAVGPGERVEAVTSWLPTWSDGEVVGHTLDFMRRRPDSMNGVMEFLIAGVFSLAQQQGLRFVSLSVAPLSGADPGDEQRLQRLLATIADLLEPVYGFRSLAAYKDKFRPEHLPQVLAYPDAVALPAITVAVARAYLPDTAVGSLRRLLGGHRGASARPEPERVVVP